MSRPILMRSRPLSPNLADAKCAICRKIPLMRFFASSLFFALMRFERSETNIGSEGKNSLLTPRTRRRERRQHFFFSYEQHLLRL
jgi:hypothetical protein